MMFVCCWKLVNLKFETLLSLPNWHVLSPEGPLRAEGGLGDQCSGLPDHSGLLRELWESRAASASVSHMGGLRKGEHVFSPPN